MLRCESADKVCCDVMQAAQTDQVCYSCCLLADFNALRCERQESEVLMAITPGQAQGYH